MCFHVCVLLSQIDWSLNKVYWGKSNEGKLVVGWGWGFSFIVEIVVLIYLYTFCEEVDWLCYFSIKKEYVKVIKYS